MKFQAFNLNTAWNMIGMPDVTHILGKVRAFIPKGNKGNPLSKVCIAALT